MITDEDREHALREIALAYETLERFKKNLEIASDVRVSRVTLEIDATLAHILRSGQLLGMWE